MLGRQRNCKWSLNVNKTDLTNAAQTITYQVISGTDRCQFLNHSGVPFGEKPKENLLNKWQLEMGGNIITIDYLRNKACFPWLYSLVKIEANVWENSRADQWKPETQLRIFSCSRVLTKLCRGFHHAMKAQTTFYFFFKIIICIVNKEKGDIQSAHCKFSQLGDSQTSLLTPFSCVIALWKHTRRPIKTHVLYKLFYNSD